MYINEREKERKKHQQLINCEKTILNNKNFKTIDYYLKKEFYFVSKIIIISYLHIMSCEWKISDADSPLLRTKII